MRRTSAALAASATVFALLLAGCSDDKATTAAPSSTGAAATTAAQSGADNAKAGTFLVSLQSAFPKLTAGKDKATLTGYFTDTCKDIKDGKSEDAVIEGVTTRTGASKDEAPAIYQMAKLLC